MTAEVFTVAWRRRHDLPDAPLPWLYGVARNCLSNAVRGYGRRRRRVGRLVGRLGNDAAAHRRHIGASLDTETPGAWVREVLDRLSGPDQEILRLAAWEELDAGQIAAVLDCGSRATAMRLHRARRRLRDEIDRMRLTPPTPGRPRDPHASAGTPEDMSATGHGTPVGTRGQPSRSRIVGLRLDYVRRRPAVQGPPPCLTNSACSARPTRCRPTLRTSATAHWTTGPSAC